MKGIHGFVHPSSIIKSVRYVTVWNGMDCFIWFFDFFFSSSSIRINFLCSLLLCYISVTCNLAFPFMFYREFDCFLCADFFFYFFSYSSHLFIQNNVFFFYFHVFIACFPGWYGCLLWIWSCFANFYCLHFLLLLLAFF